MKLLSSAALAAALSLCTLAAPAQAATAVTPGAYASTDGPAAQFGLLGNPSNFAVTFQFVVSASELTGITSGAQISALAFRFAGSPFTNPEGVATYSNYSIQIGRATNAPTALSANFAANMGADTITARSGALSIPAGTFADLPGEGPNPFYDLGFTTPYTYTGGDLAVLIRFTPTSGNPAIAVDAFAPDARMGTVFNINSATATTGSVNVGNAPITRFTFTTATAAVPEPTTWAMMIVGFGLIGGAARRRSGRMMSVA